MLKSGAQHTQSLRDGRAVFLDGAQVNDVTTHPAFRRTVASVARLFDQQQDLAERMSFATAGGGRANRHWELPGSLDALVARRLSLQTAAETHAGCLGRAPDLVASCISGLVMGLEVCEAYDPARARALAAYHRYARDNDLYLTYAILNPQADRSKGAGEQADPYLTAGVVDRDGTGLTIRGAKMLATAGIMANEVLVTCIQPLRPGEDRYAVSFALPMNAKGLTILSRKSYERAAPSVFDNPLASRFDENDAVLYFDDVHVPWDRVFVAGSVEMCQRQFHATPAHVYQNYQAMIRLAVKLRFLTGVARRTAEVNGTLAFPQVRETLGQIAAEAAMVDAFVTAMEAKGHQHGAYFVPDAHTLYAAQTLSQPLYPKLITALRELAGGGMIMLPSSVQDFADPQIAAIIGKTQQSPAADAEGRVKFYRLAWDAVGSEFASRHTQYEMFYAGAPFVPKNHSFRTYDWPSATGMVDRMMGGYTLADELAPITLAAE